VSYLLSAAAAAARALPTPRKRWSELLQVSLNEGMWASPLRNTGATTSVIQTYIIMLKNLWG